MTKDRIYLFIVRTTELEQPINCIRCLNRDLSSVLLSCPLFDRTT